MSKNNTILLTPFEGNNLSCLRKLTARIEVMSVEHSINWTGDSVCVSVFSHCSASVVCILYTKFQ